MAEPVQQPAVAPPTWPSFTFRSTPVEPEVRGWPSMLGPYRVTGLLGRGGMGVVYSAEQDVPIRRRVAVKVIHAGLPAHVAARFDGERQALALMEHPSIARVLDAGTTLDGTPWVAMEYVDGVPIGRWCDERALPTAARLRLMIAVCHAVQHAHQKGIIHRDLKPSNILVTEEAGAPLPKVIDFGIAKAVGDARLTGETLATETGIAMGTPAYMSPEQADGAVGRGSSADVDTRSDVYALGVVLYELLTGTLPIDPGPVGLNAFLARLIARLAEAPPPSVRAAGSDAATVGRARRRGTEPNGLARELRGDLDAIVLRALAPERERRYATALDLATDLERHQRHEPITARPPGTLYRLGKLARRRPAAVAVTATAILSLVALATVSTVQARRVARARAVAEQRRGQAEDLIRFMVGDLRGRLEPIGKLDILNDVGTRAMAYFAAVPAAELSDAELLHRSEALDQLGQVRLAQGDADGAMQAFRDALSQARDLAARPAVRPEWLYQLGQAEFWVGSVHYGGGALDSALAHFEPYLAVSRRLVARDTARREWQLEVGYALSNLGSVRESQGDLSGALASFRDVLAVKRRVVALAPGDVDARVSLGNSHNKVAVVHEKLGALDSARAHFDAALESARTLAQEQPASAPRQVALGDAYFFAGSDAEYRGDLRVARALLDSSCAIGAALAARDTANADWARTALVCEYRLAAVETQSGGPAAALARLDLARGAARALLTRSGSSDRARADQARVEVEVVRARRTSGDVPAARDALARVEATLAGGPRPVTTREARLALALARRERALLARTDAERRAAWRGVLDALGARKPHEDPPRALLRAQALRAEATP